MVWYPSEAIRRSVPSKSLPIVSRNGHVWHPIGNPSGLARGSVPPRIRYPTAATPVVLAPRNCLLEIVLTDGSSLRHCVSVITLEPEVAARRSAQAVSY